MSEPSAATVPSRGRAIFYVIVIFAAGAIFGSALTIGVGRHLLQRARTAATWNVEALRRVDRRLDLTAEQRARVQPILADMFGRLRDTRLNARRDTLEIIQDARAKLRAELTPEQQAEFDRMAGRLRDRFLGNAAESPRRPNAGEAPTPRP